MNEVEFRNWMVNRGIKNKIAGDVISRLKRVEREIKNCDIDEQYRNDKCEYLLSLFVKMGNNLPIGKYYMSTYRHALRLYVNFCNDSISEI